MTLEGFKEFLEEKKTRPKACPYCGNILTNSERRGLKETIYADSPLVWSVKCISCKGECRIITDSWPQKKEAEQ